MKALLTGADGFCGRHLSRHLAQQGVEVITLGAAEIPYQYDHRINDISRPEEFTKVLGSTRPDYIFHLAGVASSPDPGLFYRVNVQYASSLLEAADRAGLKECRILLVGTSAEYGEINKSDLPITEDLRPRPYNHYGISKLAQTFAGLAACRKGLRVVVARPFNIIGPGMPGYLVVGSFADQVSKIIRGELRPVVETGNLESARDYIYVNDVVGIYWKLANSAAAVGEVVNVCTGKGVVIRDILSKLVELSGTNIEIKTDPARLKPIDIPVHYGSTEKQKKITGISPELNLDEALKRIMEGLKKK
jgi:GDP-4-dehydro-6-deoxy-D-mannose reductase